MQGKITIRLRGEEGMNIEVMDELSRITFLKVKIDSKMAMDVLGGLAYGACDIEVKDLEKVGKKVERENFVVELGEGSIYLCSKDQARKIITEKCPKGWTPDLHLGSQNSFYNKGGKAYAQTSIRRWVDND